jgi:hypothetical protein
MVGLKNNQNGLCVGTQTSAWTGLGGYACGTSGVQQSFILSMDANQYTSFIEPTSGLCFDVRYANPTNGVNPMLYPCHGSANQKWLPVSLGSNAGGSASLLTPMDDDLSGVGTGDFQISFVVDTAQTGWVALLNQRGICNHGVFWDARMSDGRVQMETDDGTNYTSLLSPKVVNDGVEHSILITRVNGTLSIIIDGAVTASAASAASFTSLPPLATGTDVCVGLGGNAALSSNYISSVNVTSKLNAYLSNIGTANFHVSFDLSTTQTAMGLVNQRSTCDYGSFWGARLKDGSIFLETDGNSYTAFQSRPVNDGKLHHIDISRLDGLLSMSVDGVLSGSAMSATSFGALHPLAVGIDPCNGGTASPGWASWLGNVSVTTP